MKGTITYDENKAREVEQAVITVFGCHLKEIVSSYDSIFKKVVVHILFRFLGFKARNIGSAYSITWLYVPTLSDMLEKQSSFDPSLRDKILTVLKLIGYGKENPGSVS